MKTLLLSFLFASNLFAEDLCEKGVKSYENTLYKVLRNGPCVDCHDRGGKGPNYDVDDPRESYASIRAYIDIFDLQKSKLIYRAGNGHCSDCDEEMRTEVKDGIQAWWDGGEKDCNHLGKKFSDSVALPMNLPKEDFVTMSLPLTGLGAEWTDIAFQVEVKRASEEVGTNPGTLVVRKPRFLSKGTAVSVDTIRILVNGKFQPLANSYEGVKSTSSTTSQTSNAHAVLSAESMTLVEEVGKQTQLSVGFANLEIAKVVPACRNLEGFEKDVYPVIEKRSCLLCHNQKQTKTAKKAQAVFFMDPNVETLCRSFRQRGNPDLGMRSPFISYPLRRANGHPQVFEGTTEVLPQWLNWIESEHNTK